MVCGPYNDPAPGPYYVKLYLRFVDAGPGSFEESFAKRAETIWANLQEAFSDQNIYFVPGFSGCTGAQSFQVISSTIFPDLGNLTEFNALMSGSTNGVNHFYPDGINLFIFRDDFFPEYNGHSFCLPSNYCYVGGKSTCCPEPMSTTHTVSHEIGHCLGLVHTDNDDGCPANNSSDGHTTGDMVADTPFDDGNYGVHTSCPPGVLPENIMSTFPIATCRNKFTDGQGARMRHYLQNELGVLSQVKMDNLVITGNPVWSTPTHVPANVIIEPGATLTIQAPVFMQENAFIYVKANSATNNGGQLRVDDLITSACPDKFWQGIIIDGNEALLQSSNKQGKLVVLNDGIIEHAKVGAKVQGLNLNTGLPQPFAKGGIVWSSFGTFRNNLVDVHFEDYSKLNQSFFNFTDFITDNDFRGGLNTSPLHIFLNGVNNIKISNSDFEDLRSASFTSPQTRARGIEAINANIFVSGTTNFTHLFEGVRLTNINPQHGNSILGATFTKCFNGIYSGYNENFQFSGNTFLMERPSNYTGPASTPFTGMYLEGETAAFTVSGNTFQSTDFSSTDNYTGTDVLALTKQNNVIFNNNYFSLNTSNRANGINAITFNEMIFNGLSYECNIYQNNIDEEHLVQTGRIRREQGARNPTNNQPIPTGNRFLDESATIANQFTNNDGVDILYFQDPLSADQILYPGKYSGVSPVNSTELVNCNSETTAPCPTYPCNPIIVAGLKTQFFQQKQQWNVKMTAFPALTNSTQIHSEAISINTLRRNLDQLGNKIIMHHALDTVGASKDSVLVWLGHLDTYDADMQLAQHHFFSGNFSTANSLLSNLPTQYNLSGDVLEAHNQTISVLSTVFPALSQNMAVNALPKPVLDTLESHWGTHCSGAGALARSLLYQNDRRLYADCNGTEERDTPGGKIRKSANEEHGNQITISPNPANQTVQITRSTGVIGAQLRIIGLTGTLEEFTIPQGQNSTTLSVSHLPNGMYIVTLVEEGKIAARQKLMILH